MLEILYENSICNGDMKLKLRRLYAPTAQPTAADNFRFICKDKNFRLSRQIF